MQMKYWEAAPEVTKVKDTHPMPVKDSLNIPAVKIQMAEALIKIIPQEKGEN